MKIYINGESVHRLDRAERTVHTGEQVKDLTMVRFMKGVLSMGRGDVEGERCGDRAS